MILCSSNSILQNLILYILAKFFEFHLLIDILSNFSLTLSTTILSLGFPFDFTIFLIPQIKFLAKSSFFQLCRIKQFLDKLIFKLVLSSFILFRFDYCNSSYYGLPETSLHPLTKAFNSISSVNGEGFFVAST